MSSKEQEKGLNFTLIFDVTFSLRLLKKDIQINNKLGFYTKIQFVNFIGLIEKFLGGKVKSSWIPATLNLADLLKDTPEDPIGLVNSVKYCERVTTKQR